MTNADAIKELKKLPPDADLRIDVFKKNGDGDMVRSEDFYYPFRFELDSAENEVIIDVAD